MTLPQRVRPMLATPGEAFDSERHRFEVKWDGIRALAYLDGSSFWLTTRNFKPALPRFPELRAAKDRILARSALLDGEIVVLGPGGDPDFDLVRRRSAHTDPKSIAEASRTAPAVYIAFDLLHCDGKDLFDTPLEKRLDRLAAIVEPGEAVVLSSGVIGTGKALFEAVTSRGLEGIVGKELSSPYEPGVRSRHWIKVRGTKSADCVVAGFVPKGGHFLKSLILGLYDEAGGLHYAGHVGSGFAAEENRLLRTALDAMVQAGCPFEEVPAEASRSAVWVEPKLVCSVEYLTLTGAGRLRHPAFRAIRTDKKPRECTLLQVLGEGARVG